MFRVLTSDDGKNWKLYAERLYMDNARQLAEKIAEEDGVYTKVTGEIARFNPTPYRVAVREKDQEETERDFDTEESAKRYAVDCFLTGAAVVVVFRRDGAKSFESIARLTQS